MADAINDGGPAFPCSEEQLGFSLRSGISLRDWFAGQCLASASALPHGDANCAHYAKVAYDMADAMLKARTEGAQS